jgi:hypothetical protein
MAVKHEHVFIVRKMQIPRCIVCRESALVVLQQTEEQLAKAQTLLLQAIPLLQHAAILESMSGQQRAQAGELAEEIRATLGQEE